MSTKVCNQEDPCLTHFSVNQKHPSFIRCLHAFLKPDVVIAGTTVGQKDEETRSAMTNALTQKHLHLHNTAPK